MILNVSSLRRLDKASLKSMRDAIESDIIEADVRRIVRNERLMTRRARAEAKRIIRRIKKACAA